MRNVIYLKSKMSKFKKGKNRCSSECCTCSYVTYIGYTKNFKKEYNKPSDVDNGRKYFETNANRGSPSSICYYF